jgi:hypothetical protein
MIIKTCRRYMPFNKAGLASKDFFISEHLRGQEYTD